MLPLHFLLYSYITLKKVNGASHVMAHRTLQ